MAEDDRAEPKRDHGEVITVASELMEADREKAAQVDTKEIAAELGIPPEYVDKARVEVDRRSAKRRGRAAALAALALVAAGAGIFVATRSNAPTSASPAASASASPAASSAAGPSFVDPPSSPDALRGVVVGVDVLRGNAPRELGAALEARSATVLPVDRAATDDVLKGIDVLVLDGASRNPFSAAELDALERFVRSGHGLVAADLGWWWTSYPKKPLDELPANTLGKRLGFRFTDEVLGAPSKIDRDALDGIVGVNQRGWVACGVSSESPDVRVVVRDEALRPMVATLSADRGRIAIFGHMGIVEQNGALFAWAVKGALDRSLPRVAQVERCLAGIGTGAIEAQISVALDVRVTCAVAGAPYVIAAGPGHYYGATLRCTLSPEPSAARAAAFRATMEEAGLHGYKTRRDGGHTVVVGATTTRPCNTY